jgi:hypothetical protein
MIYLGLTTIPPRLNGKGLIDTLISLLKQTQKDMTIVLSIPKISARFNTPYEITNPILKSMIETKKIVLNYVEDFGPATKFIGLLHLPNLNPTDIMIAVDDDQIYNPELVEIYVNQLNRFSDLRNTKIALGFSGFNMNEKGEYTLTSNHLDEVEFIEGYCGIATFYANMPKLDELSKWDFLPLTPFTYTNWVSGAIKKAQFLGDDFMICRYFQLNKIKKYQYNTKTHNRYTIHKDGIESFSNDALHKLQPNNTGNMFNYMILRKHYLNQ